ncbi:MAG TPA: O-antigen ligase family protein [Pirellulales bacterium]|nr:O-antigen ligase family protein [Pirellulales bacterium]
MNTAISNIVAEPPPSRRVWMVGIFALLWAVFYLATPLDVRFTVSDTYDAVNGDMSDEDRAETNVEMATHANMARELSLLALAVFGVACLASRAERRVAPRIGGVFILGFLAWTLASAVWSGETGTTLRKAAVLGCLSMGALGVAKQFSLRQIACFAVFAGGLLLVADLSSELALGNFQPLDPEYRFTGLTWPAFNAWMLSITLLGAAVLYPTAGKWRTALVALSAAALGAILMAKTRASTAGLVAGVSVYAALTWPPRRTLLALFAGITCIAAGIMVLSLTTGNAGARLVDVVNLGRSESAEGISGRSQLWEDLMPFIADRPLTGYGYESFWTPSHLVQIGEDNWGAPDAHNGYINLTLGIGLIGAAAYVLVLLFGFCTAWIRSIKARSADYAFACGTIVVSAINAGFVSTQLSPALYSFVTLAILAHLGFIAEPIGKDLPRT